MILEYIVKEDDVNKTYKSILQNKLRLSTRLLNRLKNRGKLKVNEELMYVNKCSILGDIIHVDVNSEESNDSVIPQKGDLDILYEDDYYIAVNKKPNIVIHPCS